MFLNVKEMEVRKVRFDEAFQPGSIDFSEDDLRQATPLHIQGTATLLEGTGGEFRVEGRFRVQMEADCDRCLAPAVFPLDERFDLFYRPAGSDADTGEVGIDEGEAEMGFYKGLGLELADVIKEQVLLALPMQRVCRAECKGICPVCGSNRNEVPCRCEVKPADDRWVALKNFK